MYNEVHPVCQVSVHSYIHITKSGARKYVSMSEVMQKQDEEIRELEGQGGSRSSGRGEHGIVVEEGVDTLMCHSGRKDSGSRGCTVPRLRGPVVFSLADWNHECKTPLRCYSTFDTSNISVRRVCLDLFLRYYSPDKITA
jgi:hypothetical protein